LRELRSTTVEDHTHINTCFRALFLSASLLLSEGLPAVAIPVPLNESRLLAGSTVVVRKAPSSRSPCRGGRRGGNFKAPVHNFSC